MALEQRAFDVLKKLAPCRLLSLGYPDLLLTQDFDVKHADDWQAIAKWHNWPYPIYDTEAVFKELGIEATYFDIHASRGCEHVVDLNKDVSWAGDKFDVVLDPGTLEHVFNIGQGFWTVRRLCRAGGHIIHTNPMNAGNHGFWNLSPTVYADWYGQNGDKVIRAEILAGPLANREVYEMPPIARFTPPPNSFSLIVARRGDQPASGWPTQSKYLANPDLKHAG